MIGRTIPVWVFAGSALLFNAGAVGRSAQDGAGDVAATAGEIESPAVLRFEILDASGRSMPGRLTFLGKEGPGAKLFPNAAAGPNELAVRSNAIYSLSGRGAVTVPPGRYTVYASRGLEWSAESRELTLEAGKTAQFSVRLRHEVDTAGWISGDFHLHTLTHSGHGDANLKERIISLIGEGVEFAVATDHNHHTDYDPTIRELDAHKHITATTGNEVSTPIGHLNVFPLDPSRPPPNHRTRDAEALFKFIRKEPNKYGVTPIIQLNHPRWGGIDFFGKVGLDAVTGESDSSAYSGDFDTIEVLNENEAWGYYDADIKTDVSVGSGRHSVLRDWFNLLNQGQRYAAVGNSDSHTVYKNLAGYPRNFVASATDDAAAIDAGQVAAALRERRVFTTVGPFVEFTVNRRPMGADVSADGAALELHIRVQAAGWVDCDRVKIVVNGDVAEVIEVPDTRETVRLDTHLPLSLKRDGWVALLVEGDDPLAPIVQDQGRPIRPIAVVNPVWVDADGDGKWTSPWEQALRLVRNAPDDAALDAIEADKAGPTARGLTVLAAAQAQRPFAARFAERGLTDGERVVRLAAARAAERLGSGALTPALDRALVAAEKDAYLQVALLRAARACEPEKFGKRIIAFLERHGDGAVRRYGSEMRPLLPGAFVDEWMVVGFFPNPAADTLVNVDYGPESDASPDKSFAGKGGPTTWRAAKTKASGLLDLRALGKSRSEVENAIAYVQTYLHAPDDRTVHYTLGSDDGCRLYVNDDLIHEDNTRHGADPFGHLGRLALRRGWNRVLIKVENGGGDFGVYFRVLDDAIRWSRTPF